MLFSFGFDRLALVAADLFFQHPDPPAGQDGPEHGVRVELRLIEASELQGSVYSARPIALAEPLWRVDLLKSVKAPRGTFDRAHHHPKFTGWDESVREFDDEMSVDPVGWLGGQLSELPAVLSRANVPADTASPDDIAQLRLALPNLLSIIDWLLERVWEGDLARPPETPVLGMVRASWL